MEFRQYMERMRHLILIIVAAGLLIAMPYDNAYAFRFGNMDIDLRGRLDSTYDDNITYVPSDTKADFYNTPSLGLRTKYEGKRLSFDFSGFVNNKRIINFVRKINLRLLRT